MRSRSVQADRQDEAGGDGGWRRESGWISGSSESVLLLVLFGLVMVFSRVGRDGEGDAGFSLHVM